MGHVTYYGCGDNKCCVQLKTVHLSTQRIAKVDRGPSDTHHGYRNTMAERHCATRESDALLGEFHPLPRRSTTHASWKLVCCKHATIILSWHSWAVFESPPLTNTASGV